ncbi:unnamed protein product [Phytophthora lilii]|nr:unnamed protein product [Phytophthora lilii]
MLVSFSEYFSRREDTQFEDPTGIRDERKDREPTFTPVTTPQVIQPVTVSDTRRCTDITLLEKRMEYKEASKKYVEAFRKVALQKIAQTCHTSTEAKQVV